MYEGGCDDDSGSKVFGNEESPRRNSDALMPRSEDGKPCAQKRSDQNDEDGGDADAHAPVKVVVNRTVTHDVQFIQMVCRSPDNGIELQSAGKIQSSR